MFCLVFLASDAKLCFCLMLWRSSDPIKCHIIHVSVFTFKKNTLFFPYRFCCLLRHLFTALAITRECSCYHVCRKVWSPTVLLVCVTHALVRLHTPLQRFQYKTVVDCVTGQLFLLMDARSQWLVLSFNYWLSESANWCTTLQTHMLTTVQGYITGDASNIEHTYCCSWKLYNGRVKHLHYSTFKCKWAISGM